MNKSNLNNCMAKSSSNWFNTPKKRGATKFRKHRIAGGFDGVKLKRGFIPNKLKATDKPYEIMDIYGVSYGTACVWLRILRGPNYMP